jgi:Flp pilus assembly protein protease CpaA
LLYNILKIVFYKANKFILYYIYVCFLMTIITMYCSAQFSKITAMCLCSCTYCSNEIKNSENHAMLKLNCLKRLFCFNTFSILSIFICCLFLQYYKQLNFIKIQYYILIHCLLLSSFIISIFDLRYRLIPNRLLIGEIIVCLMFCFYSKQVGYSSKFDTNILVILQNILYKLSVSVFLAIILLITSLISKFFLKTTSESIGYGDIKLIIVSGLFVELRMISPFFILIGVLGSLHYFLLCIYKKRHKKKHAFNGDQETSVPLAPAIVISRLLLMLYQVT